MNNEDTAGPGNPVDLPPGGTDINTQPPAKPLENQPIVDNLDDAKKRDEELRRKMAEVSRTGQAPQRPTRGRIVDYFDVEEGPTAAIITHVEESGKVHVTSFSPLFGPRNFCTDGQGSKPGQWQWPARV